MNLIISPHPDDEVLGCYSILEGSFVYFVGINESKVRTRRPTKKERLEELKDVAKFCKFKYSIGPRFVNEYYKSLHEIIGDIEKIIVKKKPTTIFIPHRSMNQDHKIVHDACKIALRRHDKIPWVKNVLIYEDPQSFTNEDIMNANYFILVNIWKKMDAYAIYESQVREYRSAEILENMAHFRGSQADMFTAEGFRAVRVCQE